MPSLHPSPPHKGGRSGKTYSAVGATSLTKIPRHTSLLFCACLSARCMDTIRVVQPFGYLAGRRCSDPSIAVGRLAAPPDEFFKGAAERFTFYDPVVRFFQSRPPRDVDS